ncbi:histone H2B [Trypanosoma cruzi cruzi]|nr:histone H2B [Trypanosoma cruzi cruzi]
MCSFSSHFLLRFSTARARSLRTSNQNQVRTKSWPPPRAPSANRKKDGKRSHRKPKRTWNVYISRSLKSINNHMSMSGRTMKIVNSFVNDLFERIASEAATVVRVNKKRTLGAREAADGGAPRAAGGPGEARNGGGTKAVSHASS